MFEVGVSIQLINLGEYDKTYLYRSRKKCIHCLLLREGRIDFTLEIQKIHWQK